MKFPFFFYLMSALMKFPIKRSRGVSAPSKTLRFLSLQYSKRSHELTPWPSCSSSLSYQRNLPSHEMVPMDLEKNEEIPKQLKASSQRALAVIKLTMK